MTGIENRAHVRYYLYPFGVAEVIDGSGKIYPLIDLSYSGFSIWANEVVSAPVAMLRLFAQQTPVSAAHMHSYGTKHGFRFEDRSLSTMRLILFYMNCFKNGASAYQIPREQVKDEWNEDNSYVLTGDGAVQVKLRLEPEQQTVDWMLMTFLDSGVYRELRYQQEKFKTGKQLDQGLATRMSADTTLSEHALRVGLATLAAIRHDPTKAAIIDLIKRGRSLLSPAQF